MEKKLISERFPNQMVDRKKREKNQDLSNNLFSCLLAHSGMGENILFRKELFDCMKN